MDEQVENLVVHVRALTQQAVQQQETVLQLQEAVRNADLWRLLDWQGLLAAQRSRVTFVDVKDIGKPAGRGRNVMPQFLQPESSDPKDLNSAMAKWEKKDWIYDKRTAMLRPDDIKGSKLTEMTGGLQEHLVLNTTKRRDYDGVHEETQHHFGN